MSRIDELIQRYCPDGVQYIPLGEICSIETGRRDANAAVPGGNYNFYTTSKVVSRIETYRWDTDALLIAGNANVGDVKHFNGKFDAYQRTYVLTEFSKVVISRFLYYAIKSRFKEYLSNKTNTAAMTYIVLGTLKNFKIPVPPLEVQREIVSILDTFTQLEAELEAELEARRQQYEHYRDQLLTCENVTSGVRWVPMGDFAELVRGNGMPKSDFTDSGTPAIHYGQIYTHYGSWALETKSFVSLATAAKLAKVDCGDVVITNTSENIEDVGKSVAWLGLEQAVTGGHATVIKHRQNPKYLAYYFQTRAFADAKRKYVTGTKVFDVSAKNYAKIEVPLPSRDIQDQITEVLDDFDALASDIKTGLPAEIAARRQQYEYYRDKLLTFDELTPV